MSQSIAIANYFLTQDGKLRKKHDLTPMKLLKLVWFAHGWWMGLHPHPAAGGEESFTGAPLVGDEVPECWPWGPVFSVLYRSAKQYGNKPVEKLLKPYNYGFEIDDEPSPDLDTAFPSATEQNLRPFLDQIFAQYGQFSASKLSNMTHLPGTPWKEVVDKYKGTPPRNIDIPNDLIFKYFKRMADAAKASQQGA
ncbi:DUF4065 domain-containing protein [Phycisphaeraceae bacterium D3-23]